MRFLLQVLFSFGIVLEKVFGERILALLIQWNNRLVKKRVFGAKEKVFILLPSCLQRSGCDVKILGDGTSCQRCGQCRIGDLVGLAEEFGVEMGIVSGGRLAKEMVKKKKPGAVVAIACERELVSGIFDTYPLPVYGILNTRPKGPCKDTEVDVEAVFRIFRERE